MQQLFTDYLRSGLLGSSILILVLLMRCLLNKAPRGILCALWVLAALRLIVPFTVESRLSLQPSIDIPTASQVTPMPDLPSLTPDPLPQWSAPVDAADPMPSAPAPANWDFRQIIPAVWLCVSAALLLYTGISYRILRHKLREAVPLAPHVMESDRIGGAFLLGYLAPRIYLPAGLDPRDRNFIIAHEKAHISRGDSWWKLAGYLCCCLHWYNPLVWISYWLLCRDIEIACDQRVIQNMTLEERKSYSFALLNCGKRLSGFLTCPVAFGEVSLKQRIQKVLSYRQPSQIITVLGVVAAVFVAVCFLTSPVTDTPSPPTEPLCVLPVLTEPAQTLPAPTFSPSVPPETTSPTQPVQTTAPTQVPPTIPAETVPLATQSTQPPAPAPDPPAPPAPTEPPVTEPTSTQPPATEPPVTQPSVTEPTDTSIVAQGRWTHGPVTWKVTTDGTLTIDGSRVVQESDRYIWKDYKDIISRIVIADGITTIPEHAFSDMPHVTSIYLSNTLDRIGENAFSGCTALQSVTFPASLTVIGEYAFSGCTSLSTLHFANNGKLHTIRNYAFVNTAITSFVWPDSLSKMDFSVLIGCTRLQLYKTRWETFTRSPLYPGSEVFLFGGVETAAFCGSSVPSMSGQVYLKSVVFGCPMDEIPPSLFAGCTSLSSVSITFPITGIGNNAFKGCSSLTDFTIPDSVTTIRFCAFAESGITSITIPPSVQHIEQSVFANSSVVQIVFQGNAPQFIDEHAFSGLTATIYYPAGNLTWTEDKLQNYGGTITWIPK